MPTDPGTAPSWVQPAIDGLWAVAVGLGSWTFKSFNRRIEKLEDSTKVEDGDKDLWVALTSLTAKVDQNQREANEHRIAVAAQLGKIPTRDELRTELDRALAPLKRNLPR